MLGVNEAQRGSGRALLGLGTRPRRHGFTCRPQLAHCGCGLHHDCQASLTGTLHVLSGLL